MLTVVSWLWQGPARTFALHHALVLRRMLTRHLTIPHEFVLIVDKTTNITLPVPPDVTIIRTPPAAAALSRLGSPEGSSFPSCYRRLWLFSDEARKLGSRFLALDLDIVLTANIDHIASLPGSFVGWVPNEGVWHGKDRYGGGMFLLEAGAHPEVFDKFVGRHSIQVARAAGYRGSDQAWLNYCLYGKTDRIPDDAGILMWRDILKTPNPNRLPPRVCMVQFSGRNKPWNHTHINWVKEHWR